MQGTRKAYLVAIEDLQAAGVDTVVDFSPRRGSWEVKYVEWLILYMDGRRNFSIGKTSFLIRCSIL